MNRVVSNRNRIVDLFSVECGEVYIIAPYMVATAFEDLVGRIHRDVRIRCVSRWLPHDVAAGVSDPEVYRILERRGNFRFSLVDRLHAKMYVAGNRCLVGSVNVTRAGLGNERGEGNIEVLVETTRDAVGVAMTLDQIADEERIATSDMVDIVQRHADCVNSIAMSFAGGVRDWFPRSRDPSSAFEFYRCPPDGFLKSSDQVLLSDVARCNFPPGMNEKEFNARMRKLLTDIPIADQVLSHALDKVFEQPYAESWLAEVADDHFSENDIWLSFVQWMAHFFPGHVMVQEISTVSLRRAQILK